MDTPQTTEEANLNQLAAMFDQHQLTDADGNPDAEEAPAETTAAQEPKPSVEDSAPAEKPTEDAQAPAQAAKADDETELAEDETGKRYVPEKRFKDVYGKYRTTERELEALKTQLQQGNQLLDAVGKKPKDVKEAPSPARAVDKADTLELKLTKPQFNPASPDYNRSLDELAFKIFQTEPGLSVMEAAQKAESYARDLGAQLATAKTEARQVKALQADQGIAGRGGSRGAQAPDPSAMSEQELERYLKDTGQW